MKKAVVAVILNERNEVLLLERTGEHEKHPNEWCLPGGKVDYIEKWIEYKDDMGMPLSSRYRGWETSEEAVRREVVEELGYVMPVFKGAEHFLGGDTYVTEVFMCGVAPKDEQITAKFPNREHFQYAWFPLDNLPEKTEHNVKLYLELIG